MKRVKYAVVDKKTGEIVGGTGYTSMELVAAHGSETTVGMTAPLPVDDATWYYDWSADEFVERPGISANLDKAVIDADGVDVAEIVGLPEGADIRVRSARYAVSSDGIFRFRSRVPGTYVIRVRHFPYRDTTFMIEAR